MTEPKHDLGHACRPLPVGQLRSLEHNNRQAKFARGIDFGPRACCAGVAGNDPFDSAQTHHRQLAGKREWPARYDDFGILQRQRLIRWIDEPQSIGVLLLGAERGDMLPADGEKDTSAFDGQCRDSRSDIIYLDPVVTGCFGPWRTLKRDKLGSGRRARADRVAADLRREGMGCVDDVRNSFPMNVFGKPARTAETADPGRQQLFGRGAGASRVGIGRAQPCARDSVGKQMSVAGSAQYEGAYHA